MKIINLRMVGIRCFEDTGTVSLSPTCNVVVGHNNSGKSTLLKGIISLQVGGFSLDDARYMAPVSGCDVLVGELKPTDQFNGFEYQQPRQAFRTTVKGSLPTLGEGAPVFARDVGNGQPAFFFSSTPHNAIVPFLASRKAAGFTGTVDRTTQSIVSGTYHNLISRIDLVASYGHPRHLDYISAVEEITGLSITTRSSTNGKEAGFYLDDNAFVTLDRMGDGVTEMVAMIVELCIARDKIFVIEEPETNLHPRGVKALLALIRKATETNQFIIATHSNIVLRELAPVDQCKILRVYREGPDRFSRSRIEDVPATTAAHTALLRELGYDFGSMALHDAWLFLEESSAEEILQDVLIPMFVPGLRHRLRTYSAGGVGNLEPALAEFQRLVTFIHLQPAYRDRMWVRADGDGPGLDATERLRARFPYLTAERCSTFANARFEDYFPSHFHEEIGRIFAITDKQDRRVAKSVLLRDVKTWTTTNPDSARQAWAGSAAEVIAFLASVSEALDQ